MPGVDKDQTTQSCQICDYNAKRISRTVKLLHRMDKSYFTLKMWEKFNLDALRKELNAVMNEWEQK